MPAKENITNKAAIAAKAREIDFVTQFGRDWQHLQDLMGIMEPIKKAPGTVLKSKYAEGTLQSGTVGEGEDIPYSKFEVKEKEYEAVKVEKYAKAVSVESIAEHGYDVAVQMTDDEMKAQLTDAVAKKFYDYLKTGSLIAEHATWQKALAMANGAVKNKFKEMHRTVTEVVGFANIMDAYEWIGEKDISIQTEFGISYIQNFMGYKTLFLLSDAEITSKTVIATPVNNIKLYYVNPAESDFAKAGLSYTVDGVTPLIGYHTQGNYGTAVSECFALIGMTLFAEYLDGIAVMTVNPSHMAAAFSAPKALSSMTKDELVAYAADNGIEVDGGATKDEVYKAVKAAQEA